MSLLALLAAAVVAAQGGGLEQNPNTWVKRSPLPHGPPSPRLGYEGACVWDSRHRILIRYGGHNQGGGGEQHSELWTFDPLTGRWALKEPNLCPPGICCGQQNVFDPVQGRYLRFPSFSGSHGWQWWREIYLNDSSVWSYDLGTNTWRNLRPFPTPSPRPLRCASWDTDHQVAVLFGGEGSSEGTLVYDPYTSTWTRMNPPAQPAFRSGGNMAYDAARRLHILFGSQFSDDPHTWAYDLRRNVWRDMRPPTMPPTDRTDAVLTYDPLNQVVITLVKITEGQEENARHRLETWAYDAGANRWSKMNPPREPDPSGNRARVLSFAPELGLSILENRTHPPQGAHEQQIWTYRYTNANPSPMALPAPPTDLRVVTTSRHAILSWKPSPSRDVNKVEIRCYYGVNPWPAEAIRSVQLDSRVRTFRDRETHSAGIYQRPNGVHYYTIRAFWLQRGDLVSHLPGPESTAVRAQPRVVEDLMASVVSPNRVELAWKASPEPDVVGYHVERAAVEVYTEDQLTRLKSRTPPLPEPSVGAIRRIGPFARITRAPVRNSTFADTGIDLSKTAPIAGEPVHERRLNPEQLDEQGKPYRFAVYAYRVRAVNALGVESGPSPAVFTLPSSPQWVFSREQGTTCHLKWRANPEQGIRGYRVYRMDGRYDREPIARLTPDPVAALTHSDPAAGTVARRYYVVAVDLLGQEGFPSSPVWFNREWRQFYLPFTGEWHQ